MSPRENQIENSKGSDKPSRSNAGTSTSERGVAKRSSNACTRCRKQKIKCSGSPPCETCSKRNRVCVFDERDNKIIVTQGYISDLQSKIALLERNQAGSESSPTLVESTRDDSDKGFNNTIQVAPENSLLSENAAQGRSRRSASSELMSESMDEDITNPLAASPSTYMAATNGRTFYLGTSSNWSFSGRVLRVVHEHVYQRPLPASYLLFDGAAYDLKWDGLRWPQGPSTNVVIPSLDHAIYLINAVKFRCGQLFHLFDEDDFMARMHRFYSEGRDQDPAGVTGLWYIHFLLVLAFGQAITLSKAVERRPAGADYFVYALQHLPDITALGHDPMMSAEVLCCIALYLQSVDHRNSAHVFIGQATRIALVYGMHTEMPILDLGEQHVQRCRRIWWTVYVLDRQMTSLMGLPQSVRDEDIETKIPTFQGSTQRTVALSMQIRLSRIIAEINASIYGASGRLNQKFLTSTKAALENIAGLADELRCSLPLRLNQSGHGVSRVSAYLHLLYNQCIVLATRPLMFCCLKMALESPAKIGSFTSSRKVCTLLQLCIESCQQIVLILENLQAQGLLETFLPFDLDSLYISSVVLLIGRVLDVFPMQDWSALLQRSSTVLQEMVARGNLIAGFRYNEIQRFDEMVNNLQTAANPHVASFSTAMRHDQSSTILPQAGTNTAAPMTPFQDQMPADGHPAIGHSLLSGLHPENSNNGGFDELLTAEQLMDVADSIEIEDCEWMAHTMMQNSIW
ncbi:hypothetical protein F4810DRAFT_492398 [Camillea tinctor]|nr:hypothetical protein F4810DRAFT_492398 [Camillea tinctor]